MAPSVFIEGGFQYSNLKWIGASKNFKFENFQKTLQYGKLRPLKFYLKIRVLLKTISRYQEVGECLITAQI